MKDTTTGTPRRSRGLGRFLDTLDNQYPKRPAKRVALSAAALALGASLAAAGPATTTEAGAHVQPSGVFKGMG